MSNFIILALIIIGAAVVAFILSVIACYLDEQDEKRMRYNIKHSILCEKARATDSCSRRCKKCPWRARGNEYENKQETSKTR